MLTCLYFWTWTSTSEAASGKGLRPLASQKKSASPTCATCNPLQLSLGLQEDRRFMVQTHLAKRHADTEEASRRAQPPY